MPAIARKISNDIANGTAQLIDQGKAAVNVVKAGVQKIKASVR